MNNTNNLQRKASRYVAMLCGLLASSAYADDDWKSWVLFEDDAKPWSVSVGTRVWVNEWETNTRRSASRLPSANATDNDPKDIILSESGSGFNHNRQISADHEPAVIPFASARYGRFFIGGSYYTDTDFKFTNDILYTNQITNYKDPAHTPSYTSETFKTKFSSEGTRSEWDISVGYYLLRGLAFTVGYKEVNMTVNSTVTTESVARINKKKASDIPAELASYNISDSNKFSGPTLGLSFSLPIAYNISGYGSYTHGFMTWDYSTTADGGQTASSDANYDVAEVGLSYSPNVDFLTAHVPVNSASIFAGYRYQRLQYDISLPSTPKVKDATDTTQGFVAGINIGF